MLPGFRFVLAATVLTVSLLVFGLGAAALLRASHERFVSLPIRPAAAPVVVRAPDPAPATLAMLRVEPAPAATEPTSENAAADTLLPTDRIAALTTAPRADEAVVAPPALEPKPDLKADPKPEMPAAEIHPEPMVPSAMPPVETVIAAPDAAAAPPETAVATIDPPAETGALAVAPPEPVPQLAATLAEPETTGALPAPDISEPLVNAKPIRRPPVPRDRPAAADVMATVSDATATAAESETKPSAIRVRKPVARRAVVKRRAVARPQPRRPATVTPGFPQSPAGFSRTPFGT